MLSNYKTCLQWVLKHEGGFVNHPADPGGATNRGVIQRTYDGYRRRNGLATQSVKKISQFEVEVIYREQYWNAVRGNDLPSGVDYAVFDYGVNSGPGRSIRDLQRTVGAIVDGIIGEETLSKVLALDPADVVIKLCERRIKFLRGLKHFKTFGRGWTRRVMGEELGTQQGDHGVIDRGVMLAKNADTGAPVPIPAPKGEAPGKAFESDTSDTTIVKDLVKDPKAIGLIGSIATSIGAVVTENGPIGWSVAAVIVIGGLYLIYRLERDRILGRALA